MRVWWKTAIQTVGTAAMAALTAAALLPGSAQAKPDDQAAPLRAVTGEVIKGDYMDIGVWHPAGGIWYNRSR